MVNQDWTKTPDWNEAPEWAAFLWRDAYGAWVWSDDFPRPDKLLVATYKLFEQPTLTHYDIAMTLHERPRLGEGHE